MRTFDFIILLNLTKKQMKDRNGFIPSHNNFFNALGDEVLVSQQVTRGGIYTNPTELAVMPINPIITESVTTPLGNSMSSNINLLPSKPNASNISVQTSGTDPLAGKPNIANATVATKSTLPKTIGILLLLGVVVGVGYKLIN